MLAYSFDPTTKIYKGTKNRQLDPIQSQKQGKDVYLMPANCTDVEPLEQKDGFYVVWNGAAWEYQAIPEPEPAPEPTQEEKEQMVRAVRNSYLDSTDKMVACPDFPITAEEKEIVFAYRQYLRDYTKSENWFEKNPLTLDEYKAQ